VGTLIVLCLFQSQAHTHTQRGVLIHEQSLADWFEFSSCKAIREEKINLLAKDAERLALLWISEAVRDLNGLDCNN